MRITGFLRGVSGVFLFVLLLIPGACVPDMTDTLCAPCLAYSGLMDIVLALLPWSVVWNLQMRKKEKIGVAVAMSMGVL